MIFFKTAFVKTFLLIFVLLLLVTICINLLIDPRGEFGTGVFPVVVVATARSEKINYLKLFNPKPDALIMGSSICMRYSPEVLNRLGHVNSFNLSVNSAKTEDILALLKYSIFEIGIRPKLILLGVNPRSINSLEREGVDNRLLSIPELREYLPFSRFSRNVKQLESIGNSININYFQDTFSSIKAHLGLMQFDPKYQFQKNGFLNIEGKFNKKGRFVFGETEYSVKKFSEDRVSYLENFFEICLAYDIQVKVVLNPYSEEYLLAVKDQYLPVKEAFLRVLESLQEKYRFEIHDFDSIQKFDGLDEFMGVSHPSIFNSSLVLKHLFQDR